jgi:predicted N-acyltransferase
VFNKNQRRNIRRERASMPAQGIHVESVPGEQAPDSYYGLMYRYYSSTNDQFGMWAARYLTEDFFNMLAEACPERILFTAGLNDRTRDPIGLAMLLRKPNRLIGRYWGASEFVSNLHFDLCYYEPIDWAIRHAVREFDPGMGSSHKIRRGFRAVATTSLHHFYDERMQLVMRMNIDRINDHEQAHIDDLNTHLPFAQR